MVNFSYMHLPAYPLTESIDLIKKADRLGFYGAYSVDETWWKDMWLLFAAAAADTTQIKDRRPRTRPGGSSGGLRVALSPHEREPGACRPGPKLV